MSKMVLVNFLFVIVTVLGLVGVISSAPSVFNRTLADFLLECPGLYSSIQHLLAL